MTRLLATLALMLALVSVVTPSFAVGSRGFVPHPDALLLLQDDGSYMKAPCQLTGGKHCRPDMGVLPVVSFLDPVPAKPLLRETAEIVRDRLATPPMLPPPRAA